MTQEEKLGKVCKDFSSLSGDKQDYILGILRALVFAKDEMGTSRPVEADKNNIEGGLYEKQAGFNGNAGDSAGIRICGGV
jgi:hypothetical protein